MHKYVLILLSLLTPFGFWCAGCQRETARAPMPKGPETARLARAPGTGVDESAAMPPSIPALIDPEVLAAPDQPTFERIRAVMDREANLTTSMNDAGLFVLPRQDYYPEMALAPQPAPTIPREMREIWSRPVQPAPGTPRINLSPELSAMAPASPPEPVAVNRLEAYPAYSMPAAPSLTPLPPMALPSAAAALIPPPPAMTPPGPATPVNQGTEAPSGIPGLYFGPGDPPVSALSEKFRPEEKKEAVTADYFSNPDFGLLASVASLDDLASLFLAEAPRPAEAAPQKNTAVPAPPMTPPVQNASKSPTTPSGLLDFSVVKPLDASGTGPETESSRTAAATWDAFTPPAKPDRQSTVLDPLIDYDFSTFAKREEKPASQKVRLTPVGDKPGQEKPLGKPASHLIEPEAPPLL